MKQQRNTKQRQMILDAVNNCCHHHPSADEIYLYVRNIDEKISRGTVYRNLNILIENGDISKVKISNVERFDCRTDRHYHLMCTKCGALSDLPLPYDDDMDKSIEKQTGYLIDRHKIVFEGLCPQCQKDEE